MKSKKYIFFLCGKGKELIFIYFIISSRKESKMNGDAQAKEKALLFVEI